MSITIRPDPLDRFVRICIDGSLIDAANPNQDIEFEVYSVDGALIAAGRSKASLDKALLALRTNTDTATSRKAAEELARRIADRALEYYAAGEVLDLAARTFGEKFQVAELPSDVDEIADEDELAWRAEGDPEFTPGICLPKI